MAATAIKVTVVGTATRAMITAVAGSVAPGMTTVAVLGAVSKMETVTTVTTVTTVATKASVMTTAGSAQITAAAQAMTEAAHAMTTAVAYGAASVPSSVRTTAVHAKITRAFGANRGILATPAKLARSVRKSGQRSHPRQRILSLPIAHGPRPCSQRK